MGCGDHPAEARQGASGCPVYHTYIGRDSVGGRAHLSRARGSAMTQPIRLTISIRTMFSQPEIAAREAQSGQTPARPIRI